MGSIQELLSGGLLTLINCDIIVLFKEDKDMSYELTGTVKLIGELQTFNSGFSKKEMVVTVEEGL